MKKFSVKTIVAIGIGAALFFVLGRFVAIPSPVPNTSISVQYGLLAFLAVVYGPVAGALVGFIGHTLIDFSYGWGVWWSWVIASAVFGLLMGLAAKTMKMEEGELGKKGLIKFNISQLVLMAAIANAVTTAIVGSLLCVAYAATKTKAGSLTKE